MPDRVRLCLMLAGTLPGVIAGAVIRVEFISDPGVFAFVAAGVLLPLGLWLLLGAGRATPLRGQTLSPRAARCIWGLALVVGTAGGIYDVGGGSLLAPILIAVGFSPYLVAPATIATTFVTSIVGIATYQVLQATHQGAIAPR